MARVCDSNYYVNKQWSEISRPRLQEINGNIPVDEWMNLPYRFVLGWGTMLVFSAIHFTSVLNFLYLITLPFYIVHLVMLWKRSGKNLDPALPLLVLSTFVFAVLAGICF